MASSQVEISSFSQRFGFILRDRNQKSVVYKKNLKNPVSDHLYHHELFESPVSDENSENLVNSWIETLNKKNDNNNGIVRLTEKPIVRNSRVLAPPVESVSRKEKSEESRRNGAFSLVQIWEARLNRSNGRNSPSHYQSTVASSRSDSGVSVQDSCFSESPSFDVDSELDYESEIAGAKSPDRTLKTESGSQVSVSDSGESKWGRVADLIRKLSNEEKLTAGGNGGGGLSFIRTPSPCISSCSSSEKSSLPMVNFSPRLRGRQAFTDLLIQMERDRHRELDSLLEHNAVSRFTQRGRLQSMLRLRNLKRCLAIQDQYRSNAKLTALNRIGSGSAVLHLRDRFRADAVNAAAAADKKKVHHRSAEMNNKTVQETEVITDNKRLNNGSTTLDASFTGRLHHCNRKIEEATLCKEEETVNGTVGSKMNCLQLQETKEVEEICNDNGSEKKEEEKTNPSACVNQECRVQQNRSEENMENFMQETPERHCVVRESYDMDQYLEQQETSYLNVWEEQEEYEDEHYYYGETKNDWLSEISRPRSYWEELRKSRYLEVLNTRSEKEDIRRLLERRTVTDYLKSGLREQIDRLMMSRVQSHSNKHSEKWEPQQEEEEEEQKNETEEEIGEEEPLTEGEEQGDRDDSSRSSSSQMFESSPAGSWSSQDTEVTQETEVVSNPVLSVHNPHSPEMDLISGMKSHLQQLQQEMSLLRDSVKTCLDANASLQQSVHGENPMKRKCCVCDETKVETVLYRCGHMCMCLKCANELHWAGGKCPICRAQIMDVVCVFFDTRN